MKRILTLIPTLGLAALLAAPALAQDAKPLGGAKQVDAKTKPAKEVKAKGAGEAKEQEPAAGGDVQADPKEQKGGRFAGKGEEARKHREVLKPVAMEEARYRKRIAQLERIEEIATRQGKTDQLSRIEELRVRNDEFHDERMTALRAKHGDQQVDAALSFIEQNGKGKAVQGPRGRAGREKLKEQTGDKADQRARDAKEQRDRNREKIKDQKKDPDQQ